MTVEGSGSVDVGWLRLVEGILATAVMAALFVGVVGVDRVRTVLAAAHLGVYGLTFLLSVVWLLAWSETLFLLFDLNWPDLDRTRFRLSFLAGMGIRGLVPGGSVNGPGVVAYVVTTSTDADVEGGVAMAYLAEFCYWIGSVVLAVTGFAAIVALQGPSRQVVSVAATLGVVLCGVLAGVAIGIRHPDTIEGPTVWVAGRVRGLLGERLPAVRSALAPGAVRERLDRFFAAFERFADQPRHVVPALGAALSGWVAHVLVLAFSLAALGVDPPVYVLLFVVPVGGVARALSVLPGGIGGVAPTMAVLLWSVGDVPLGVAGTGVLLFRLSTYWFRLALGAASLLALSLLDAAARRRAVADPE